MKLKFAICLMFLYIVQVAECQNNQDFQNSGMPSSTTALPAPICQNAYNKPEMVNGVPKNCAKDRCAPGYDCEYNRYYEYDRVLQSQNPMVVQYICCGGGSLRPTNNFPLYTPIPQQYTSFTRPPQSGLGQVMMTYFDPTVPMKCYYTPNCSLFPNYLNCVDSAKYGTKVCCSSNICP